MKTLEEIITEAQQVVTDLQALNSQPAPTPTVETPIEVKVEEANSTEEVFVPEAPVTASE